MSDEVAARPQRRGAVGGRALRLVSLLVLLVGAGLYLRELRQNLDLTLPRVLLPLAPLELPAELAPAPDLGVPPGAAAGRDVVLVTLDTTRPDRLGLYGNQAIETPTLDRLGREGVVFSKAVATAPVTLPAHASILTGLYPYGHGARANGVFAADATRPTLAEILAAHGYDTAAFVSSFALDARFGLDRGFAIYDDKMTRTGGSIGFSERRGGRDDRASHRLAAGPHTRPYFLWVHYYDPHTQVRSAGALRLPVYQPLRRRDRLHGRTARATAGRREGGQPSRSARRRDRPTTARPSASTARTPTP